MRFDPNVTKDGDLSAVFTKFTESERINDKPAYRTVRGVTIHQEELTIYTDGSCINNRDVVAKAGLGVWFGAIPIQQYRRDLRYPPGS